MTLRTYRPMRSLSPAQTMEPYGKVNIRQQLDGRLSVRAYMLMEPANREKTRTGIAIDGSGTMKAWFGARRRDEPNIVSPFVQQMCAYLAQFDRHGSTTAIYWATGQHGRTIEEIGTLSAERALQYEFTGPSEYGNHTYLLPALRYFTNRFSSAPWGLYVFITDGRIEDLAEVKQYTIQLARQISTRRRNNLKLVIIGVGGRIDQAQMIELDNLDTGTGLDIWDHKIATTMQHLAEIFTEVIDESVIVAPQGRIIDSKGQTIKDYRDTGVPALLEFVLPAGSSSFSLEIGQRTIRQPL